MYLYDRKVLKQAAKNDLKGKYWISALVCLILEVILYCSGYIHMCATLLVSGPLGYGFAYYFTNILRYNEAKIENLFVGFKNYVSTLVLGLLRLLFVVLWSLLFVIPGIIKYIAYSMAFYIQRDNPEMTAKECIDASVRLTDGHKGKIFMLALSFFGWYILASFAVGLIIGFTKIFVGFPFYYVEIALYSIGMILIMPYYAMSLARMYDFLILNYNEERGGSAYAGETENVGTEEIVTETSEETVATETTSEENRQENPFDL